jgi:hypothetical protein
VDVGASLTVVVVIVNGSIGSLKPTVTVVFVATPNALSAGDLEMIVGAVLSVTVVVVKFEVNWETRAFPATSFTPVVTVSV